MSFFEPDPLKEQNLRLRRMTSEMKEQNLKLDRQASLQNQQIEAERETAAKYAAITDQLRQAETEKAEQRSRVDKLFAVASSVRSIRSMSPDFSSFVLMKVFSAVAERSGITPGNFANFQEKQMAQETLDGIGLSIAEGKRVGWETRLTHFMGCMFTWDHESRRSALKKMARNVTENNPKNQSVSGSIGGHLFMFAVCAGVVCGLSYIIMSMFGLNDTIRTAITAGLGLIVGYFVFCSGKLPKVALPVGPYTEPMIAAQIDEELARLDKLPQPTLSEEEVLNELSTFASEAVLREASTAHYLNFPVWSESLTEALKR